MSFKDHFSIPASAYAQARPGYPAELFAALAEAAPDRALAWDAGSGNGQAAIGLAAHFDRVVATEPSEAQLREAKAHPQVAYHRAAETAPMLAPASVALATAAQAAHWFDLDRYYGEVRRVVRPGGVVAIWTYELCRIAPAIDAIVDRFYRYEVGPYWPPERRHCESGYREMPFPFPELPFPAAEMRLGWDLGALLAYVGTWSAVIRYRQARGTDPLPPLADELGRAWGDPTTVRRAVWPISGRMGRLA